MTTSTEFLALMYPSAATLDRTTLLAATVASVVIWAILRTVTPPNASVMGIPQIPGIPIFGNLLQSGRAKCQVHFLVDLAKKHGPVFQLRLGNRHVVFVNSFDAIRDIFVKQHQALISRPLWHTFHTVASGGKDFTIGSSPWDNNVKRLRQIVAQDATRTAVQTHVPIIAEETAVVIGRIFEESQQQGKEGRSSSSGAELDPGPYLRHYCINMVLREYLGLRLHHTRDASVMDDLILAERSIAKIRSMANNFQDFIPWLRLWPARDTHARAMNRLQDKFTDELVSRFHANMAAGTTPKCVARELLNSYKGDTPETLDSDIKILLLSVIAASVLTVPGNIIMPVAWLGCASAGPATQDAIYEDLMATYGGDIRAAWDGVVTEERAPRLVAFVKESLRYWTVLPLSLGRESTRAVRLPGGGIAPAGTEFHMNAWAGNTDLNRFERPHEFNPKRYLGKAESDLDHLSFGAGSRMCPGMHLGKRIVYAMLGRIVLAYRVEPPSEERAGPELDPLGCRVNVNGLALDPKPFKVRFVPREESGFMREVVEAAKVARGDDV